MKSLYDQYPTTDSEILKVKDNKTLVIVFDEISELLKSNTSDSYKSFYILLKKALTKFKKSAIFAIFIDTIYLNAKIGWPLKKSNKNKLFKPIYLLPTWDMFSNLIQINDINDTVKIENVAFYGRPLWGSYAFYKQQQTQNANYFYDNNLKNLLRLAQNKLTGGYSEFDLENLDYKAKLALIGCRIGCIKPKSVSLSNELVAGYMAMCIYINEDDNLYECMYPSEPFLALASQLCMNHVLKNGTRLLVEIITNVKNLIESSVIDIGKKGEMIGKIILVHAMDTCLSKTLIRHDDNPTNYLNYVKVNDFINELYGQDGIDLINNQLKELESNKILNGFINFNHFVNLNNKNAEEVNLKDALKRCAAIHCTYKQRGIDLLIPVCLSEKSFDSISAIMIQIKLHKDPKIPTDLHKKSSVDLKLTNIDDQNVPFIFLFIQLGGSDNKKLDILKENFKPVENRALLYSQSISKNVFKCLDDSIVKELKNLAVTQNKIYEHLNDDTEKDIFNKISNPFTN